MIKLYAWEPPMEGVIMNLREKELTLIRKAACLRTFSDMLNSASPFLVNSVFFLNTHFLRLPFQHLQLLLTLILKMFLPLR